MTDKHTPDTATPAQIDAARTMYAQGTDYSIEIDDGALVSNADEGAWVQAWVWVPHPADEPDEDEGPEPPYAGYESEAALRRMAEVRALRAKGQG